MQDEEILGEMAPCFEANNVRCCGVSSRSFIGMFGKADDGAANTERANTEDELANMAGDSRETESLNEDETTPTPSNQGTETEIDQPNQVLTMVFPSTEANRSSHVLARQNEGLGIPVQVIYASEEDVRGSAFNSKQSEEIIVEEPTLTDNLNQSVNEKRVRKPLVLLQPTNASLKSTTHFPIPSATQNPTFIVGKERRRRPFRPVSSRSHQTDILAESEPVGTKATPSTRPWSKGNRDHSTTTVAPTFTTSLPVKTHRRRLFNAENRLNYLRKKATQKPSKMKELIVETATEPEPQTPDIIVPVPITILKKPMTRVDKEHRFMIEQVRFMLAQDTRRFAMVPIHSAFSTMAVAGVVPKPVMEDDVKPLSVEIKNVVPSTEKPNSITTEDTTARPFRGRKRYRFAGLMPRSNTKSPKVEPSKEGNEVSQRRGLKSNVLATVNRNDIIETDANPSSNDKSTIKGLKYQRRTRRVNETENEFTFPSSGPTDKDASPTWSEMFPPTWMTEQIIEDPYRSTNQTSETEVDNAVAEVAPTMSLPTFLQAWSQFLPAPFWSTTTPSALPKEDETIDAVTPFAGPDPSSFLTATDSPTVSSWFPSSLIPSRFWSTKASKVDVDTQTERSLSRVLDGNIETSNDNTASNAQNEDELTSVYTKSMNLVNVLDEPNFSGLVTLNGRMEPLQIVGPIPKFNPPNDAGHIEFELPLETGEIVIM